MHYSPYQLAYFADKLTPRGATDSMDRMASALLDAQVELKAQFPKLSDFERDFPSLCFALATGVGKTRLMGAFSRP